TLNDGGTATYDAAKSTATSLVFDYTTASTDSNVASLQVSSVNLTGGATIQDGGGNNANLSLTGLTYSGPQIDASIPTLTAVAETPSTGDLGDGNTVTLTLSTSEVVPYTTLFRSTLNDGGTATYDAAKSTATSL